MPREKRAGEERSDHQIRDSELPSYEEGLPSLKMALKITQPCFQRMEAVVSILTDNLATADERQQTATDGREEVSISKGHPPEDIVVFPTGGAQQSGGIALGGDYRYHEHWSISLGQQRGEYQHTIQRDGNTLGQNITISSHERGDLAQRIDLQQLLVPVWILVLLGQDNLKLQALAFGQSKDGCRPGGGLCWISKYFTEIDHLVLTSWVYRVPNGMLIAIPRQVCYLVNWQSDGLGNINPRKRTSLCRRT